MNERAHEQKNERTSYRMMIVSAVLLLTLYWSTHWTPEGIVPLAERASCFPVVRFSIVVLPTALHFCLVHWYNGRTSARQFTPLKIYQPKVDILIALLLRNCWNTKKGEKAWMSNIERMNRTDELINTKWTHEQPLYSAPSIYLPDAFSVNWHHKRL